MYSPSVLLARRQNPFVYLNYNVNRNTYTNDAYLELIRLIKIILKMFVTVARYFNAYDSHSYCKLLYCIVLYR